MKDKLFYTKVKALLILNYLLDKVYDMKQKVLHTLKTKSASVIRRLKL